MKRLHVMRPLWVLLGVLIAAVGCIGDAGSGDSSVAETPPELRTADPPDDPSEDAPSPEDTTEPPEADVSAVSPLMNPTSPEMNMMAPATFRARFTTTAGDFVVELHREWAPNGVDRFYNLVRNGFYDGTRFFRVLDGFMAQWGINGDPAIQGHWRGANIMDDPVVEGNTRGRLTYAKGQFPNSRSTQLFINYGDNSRLDSDGFAAIGEVIEGMDVVDQLHSDYGEGAPRGTGPDQGELQMEGNAYLEASYPDLDYIERAEIVDQR